MKLINPISQIFMIAAVVGGGSTVSWVCLGLGLAFEVGLAVVLSSSDDE